jgi:translocation and assembly module TamB
VWTTVFNGDVSANLHLQGTFRDPVAVGNLRINSGSVRFPFGSLEVQQGLIPLTLQDPFHPQLSIKAASRQFGYDIRLEVTGTVDAPVIQFSSSPPLSSEQIVLLLTAGALPQGTAYNLTSEQRAQTMALFVGRDLLASLGYGSLGEQRLTVHSGEQISETGKPTYNVEYKLSDTVSLVGEYDRFGDLNAGIKWRIYSR